VVNTDGNPSSPLINSNSTMPYLPDKPGLLPSTLRIPGIGPFKLKRGLKDVTSFFLSNRDHRLSLARKLSAHPSGVAHERFHVRPDDPTKVPL
jgi:hypothetical protein